MTKELKPCRTCGSIARIYEYNFEGYTRYAGKCDTCGDRTQFYTSEQEAIEAWNRRTGNEG